jgi:hypothetical protein
MSDWTTCNVCGLKHTARADGTCPRCKSQLGATAGALVPEPLPAGAAGVTPPAAPLPVPASAIAPASTAAPAAAPSARPTTNSIPLPSVEVPQEPFPLGARLAGGVLFANVLLTFLAVLVTRTSPADSSNGFGGFVSIAIDLAVGTMLVSGRDKSRGIALARVVLGALVLTPILWSNAGPLLGLMQLGFSGALLLLLAGRPGPVRMGTGLALAAGVLVLGLAVVTSPRAAGAARGMVADLVDRGAHVEDAEGSRAPWRLTLPTGHWHEHTPEKQSGAERAFVWPELDAAAYVVVASLPKDREVSLENVVDAVMEAMRKDAKSFEEHERRTFATQSGTAMSLRVSMVERGVPVQGWVTIHAGAGEVGTVVAVSSRDLPEVMDELLEVGSALELGPAEGEPSAVVNEAAEDAAESEVDDGPAEGGEPAAAAP